MTEISKVSFTSSSAIERAGLWIHKHPTTVKALEVAGLVLGAALLLSPPFTAATLGVGGAVGLAATGLLPLGTAAALSVGLDLLVPPHHDMKHHAFPVGKCDGGRLYYEGDVPVLSLDADDPFKAGQAQGYLCGDALNRLSKRFHFVLHTLARMPRATELPHTLRQIRETIPPQYLREMEGVLEGYQRWSKEHPWQFPIQLTIDDLLLIHLLPDSIHFDPSSFEHNTASLSAKQIPIACTSIVGPRGEFVRNMDWPTFGLSGTYSIVVHRKHEKDGLPSSLEVGMPGFVGTLTGMNDRGLSLAMNVAPTLDATKEIRGMPAAFFNRACLENCAHTEDVRSYVTTHSPLGPYHLTTADASGRGLAAHFYQSLQGTLVIRELEEGKPLVTLNDRYSPEPSWPMHMGVERKGMLDEFFQKGDRPLEEARSLPFVNNLETSHSVVMGLGRFSVTLDNALAGAQPLHDLPVEKLLPQRDN